MKTFYENPTQVMFIEKNEVIECGADYTVFLGIAYEDYIICGCCGSVLELNEMLWVKELSWIDIQDAMAGDIFSEGVINEYTAVVDEFMKEEGIEI